jgi:hypothetical protein
VLPKEWSEKVSQRDAVCSSFIYDTGAAAVVAQWLRDNSDRPVVTFDGDNGTYGVWGHIRGGHPIETTMWMDDELVPNLSDRLVALIAERKDDPRIGRFEIMLRSEDWELATVTYRFDNGAKYARDPEHLFPTKEPKCPA